jgi:hypothetical protein
MLRSDRAKCFTSRLPRAIFALAVAAPIALAGCSADDVELNGKIFDAVGLSGPAAKSAEPKMKERAGLVMPPNPERVPEPGLPAEGSGAVNEVAALNDPDKMETVSRKELERQQAEYCKVNYEQAKARGDNDADQASGPLGPCRGSVFSAIKSWSGDEPESDEN